jgi:hypothetical protein
VYVFSQFARVINSNREDEVVKHSALPNYQLRTIEPHLCDPSVQQYSGYLDVTDGKHLFFWYAIVQLLLISDSHSAQGSSSRGAIQAKILSSSGSMVVPVAAPLLGYCLNSVPVVSPMKGRTQRTTLTLGISVPTSFSLTSLLGSGTRTPRTVRP